jgi:hypothetical protein
VLAPAKTRTRRSTTRHFNHVNSEKGPSAHFKIFKTKELGAPTWRRGHAIRYRCGGAGAAPTRPKHTPRPLDPQSKSPLPLRECRETVVGDARACSAAGSLRRLFCTIITFEWPGPGGGRLARRCTHTLTNTHPGHM